MLRDCLHDVPGAKVILSSDPGPRYRALRVDTLEGLGLRRLRTEIPGRGPGAVVKRGSFPSLHRSIVFAFKDQGSLPAAKPRRDVGQATGIKISFRAQIYSIWKLSGTDRPATL